jgi:aminoglycoside 3-N-acetyltransferase I
METEILKLTNNDIDNFLVLIKIFEEAFEWEDFLVPQRHHLQRVLQNPNFLVFVAKTDKKIIGGLTAYVLDRYDTEKPSAYIYDLAVVTKFQRLGIGKLLIATLNDFCQTNGFSEVFVQAEADDIQAVNFYKTTPYSNILNATHFSYNTNKSKNA